MVDATIGVAMKCSLRGARIGEPLLWWAGPARPSMPPVPRGDRIERGPQSPALAPRIDFGSCERRITGVAKEVPG